MTVYPFGFTVIVHEEYDDNTRTSTYRRESGMGLADSYMTAVQQLDNYYGEDLISIKHLELFAENNIILLPEDVMMGYSKTDFGFAGCPCDVDGNVSPEFIPTDTIARDVVEKGDNVYEC